MKDPNYLKNYIKSLKQISPPPRLRHRILNTIDQPAQKLISQLKIATAFSVLLVIISFSVFSSLKSSPDLITSLEIEPNSYIESVLMDSNGLSQATLLATLVEFE